MEFIVEYWLEFFFGIMISVIGYLCKKIIEYHKIIETTKRGVQTLLKCQIIEKYNEFNKKGFASLFDREILGELYFEYKNLGGNGLISRLVEDIEKISLEKPKVKEGENGKYST